MAKNTEKRQFTQIDNIHIKAIGYELAGFLAYLYATQCYYRSKQPKELLNGKWFYRTIESVTNDTGLTKKQQAAIIIKLKSLSLIDTCTQYNSKNGQKTRYFFVQDIEAQNEIIDFILNAPKKPQSEYNFAKKKQSKELDFSFSYEFEGNETDLS